MENFKEMAEQFLDAHAGVQVTSGPGLGKVWIQLIEDNAMRERMGAAARAISERNRGATERSLDHIAAVWHNRAATGAQRMTLKQSLLWPLSLPYGAAAHLRARAYRKGILKAQQLDGTVISVGNLTTGGTGKTPMVLWIAERLLAERKNVGILTRGYRGEKIAPRTEIIRAAAASTARTSDEVRLLQSRLGNRVQFGVGANRYQQGRELAKRGVNWFVLDDGFQHLQLARDVDIVLIDATNPFSGGRAAPCRAPPRAALRSSPRQHYRNHPQHPRPRHRIRHPPRFDCSNFLRQAAARCDSQFQR